MKNLEINFCIIFSIRGHHGGRGESWTVKGPHTTSLFAPGF